MSGFEIFGLLFAIPPAIIQLKQAVDVVREQYRAFIENDTDMTRVTAVYESLSDLLPGFSEQLRTHAHILPPFSLAALTYDFQDVMQRMDRASCELRDIATRDAKRTQVARFLRSRHIKQDWQQLESHAYQLMHAIRHMSVTCTAIDVVISCLRGQEQRMVHELNNIRQSLFCTLTGQSGNSFTGQANWMHQRGLTAAQTPHRSLRDVDMNFVCTIHCPKNPPYVVTEFADPDSPESHLLSRIMREEPNETPDIYSSRKIELTGKGGRGKTCILRSLCTNETIVSKFTGMGKGGIYYLNLGYKPRANDVRRKMYDMVECSGGGHLRDKMLNENISICISLLVEWFRHKDTLFLIDEAYDDTELGASVTEQLIALSTTSASSAVVFSRKTSLFSLGEVVRMYPEGESGSRALLLRSADFDESEISNVRTHEAIASIVEMCNGNMRLLGQAGVCYKHLCAGEEGEARWRILAERLQVRLGDGEDEREAQDALISEILDALQTGIDKMLVPTPSVHRLYRALHVVNAREWIPVSELCGVWGLECGECGVVAEALLRGRLCRISDRVVGGVVRRGVEIHDCLWGYMVRQAVKYGEMALTA